MQHEKEKWYTANAKIWTFMNISSGGSCIYEFLFYFFFSFVSVRCCHRRRCGGGRCCYLLLLPMYFVCLRVLPLLYFFFTLDELLFIEGCVRICMCLCIRNIEEMERE